MKKAIIALLVLVISGVAILYGSLWYLTQQFVDNQVFQAKPFAQISYKKIEPSIKGSAKVSGIRFFIPSINETIFIKSVEFIAPDLITFLSLNSQAQQKQIPQSLRLIITNAVVNLNGPVMDMIDNPDIEPSALETFSTLACGDINRIGSRSLSKMGYDSIKNNINLSYQFFPEKKQLTYTLSNHIEDMTRISISGKILNVANLKSFSANTLKAEKISLEIEDDSYIKRKNDFCALQQKYSVSEYITEHIRQVKEYLTVYGIELDDAILNAYEKLLITNGNVRVEADLSSLYDVITEIEELKSFTPNDIIQFIHLKLFLNSQRINQLSVKVDSDKLIAVINNDKNVLEIPDSIKKKQVLVFRKYHRIFPDSLTKYNGYRIKLETKSGKRYRGNLNTENPKYYEVIIRMRSGNIGYQFSKQDIKKIEVFY